MRPRAGCMPQSILDGRHGPGRAGVWQAEKRATAEKLSQENLQVRTLSP